MRDHNLCEHCEEFHDLRASHCGTCRQSLVLDAAGAVSVWRLGDLEDGLLGPVPSPEQAWGTCGAHGQQA